MGNGGALFLVEIEKRTAELFVRDDDASDACMRAAAQRQL